MKDNEQIVIKKDKMEIVAMHFPYRKKVGLGIYDYHKNIWAKVATFNNDKCAEYFMYYLATLVGAKREDEVTE